MEPGVEVRSQNQKVQLGCGTLILIAIIVAIFSGGNQEKKLRNDIRELHEKVDRLERKIDAMTAAPAAPAAPLTATTTTATPSP